MNLAVTSGSCSRGSGTPTTLRRISTRCRRSSSRSFRATTRRSRPSTSVPARATGVAGAARPARPRLRARLPALRHRTGTGHPHLSRRRWDSLRQPDPGAISRPLRPSRVQRSWARAVISQHERGRPLQPERRAIRVRPEHHRRADVQLPGSDARTARPLRTDATAVTRSGERHRALAPRPLRVPLDHRESG